MSDGPASWLADHWDGLGFALFASGTTGAAVGLSKGARGLALLTSHTVASVLTLIAYPLVTDKGYSWMVAVPVCAVLGGIGMALLRLLVALSDAIDRRRARLADNILDRVAREAEEKKP